MNFSSEYYYSQVQLLLEVLPLINDYDQFALKGGTAINLFIRNLPRLSVDIDLTYLPIKDREASLKDIEKSLQSLAQKISSLGDSYLVKESINQKTNQVEKLLVQNKNTQIIIEANPVIRGSVFGEEIHTLCTNAQEKFLCSFKIKTLSFADLYGGKICAALDRHHPRDLFDVKLLLDNEGIANEIIQALVVYLASSGRPIHELLNLKPNLQQMKKIYSTHFDGMTTHKISYDELENTMYLLIHKVLDMLTQNQKLFLLSINMGQPEWSLLSVNGIDKLPAIHWKLININTLKNTNYTKYQNEIVQLKYVLGIQ